VFFRAMYADASDTSFDVAGTIKQSGVPVSVVGHAHSGASITSAVALATASGSLISGATGDASGLTNGPGIIDGRSGWATSVSVYPFAGNITDATYGSLFGQSLTNGQGNGPGFQIQSAGFAATRLVTCWSFLLNGSTNGGASLAFRTLPRWVLRGAAFDGNASEGLSSYRTNAVAPFATAYCVMVTNTFTASVATNCFLQLSIVRSGISGAGLNTNAMVVWPPYYRWEP
jgi:hypothetical protein